MAKDILRQDVKDVIAAYKGGELGPRSVATQRVPPVGIGVKNAMFSNVATGTPLKIDGFSQELEYDAALAKLLNNALYLAATAPDETTPVEQIATTLEPIPAGKLGRAEASIFPAKVTFPEGGDDYEFATATFNAATSGPFRIVAKSKLNAERVAVCALAKIAATASGPFVFDYVERQPSYPTGSYISNRTWRDEYTPNGLKCYLCYCDLYDDREATLDALFAKKLRWDVTSLDWTGIHKNGIPYEFYQEGSSTVLTPVCCGIQATVLSGSVYEAEDVRTWSHRNGFTSKPPLTGRAFFPFPITLEFAHSWNDAEDERAFFDPYQGDFSENDPPFLRCVLDHPRRHFEALDDVPDVFFLPGLRGATIQLLCPVCYVPKQADYIFDFETVYETDDAFRFALETRPFKNAKGDRYAKKYWEADGMPPDSAYSAVAIGYKSARFTTKFSTAKGTPETPSAFAATVDGATATFTWGTRQYATNYPLRIENLAGKIAACWAPVASPATWTAKESGDYVAYLAAANAVDARSAETSVAFSVVVPPSE